MTHPTAWLFEDWPDGTFARQAQLLNTAMARLAAVLRRELRPVLERTK